MGDEHDEIKMYLNTLPDYIETIQLQRRNLKELPDL